MNLKLQNLKCFLTFSSCTHVPVLLCRVSSSDLRFYQQVKLVNFIRRQIHQSRCYGCQEKFDSREDAVRHIVADGHVMKLPDVSTWNQPQ